MLFDDGFRLSQYAFNKKNYEILMLPENLL